MHAPYDHFSLSQIMILCKVNISWVDIFFKVAAFCAETSTLIFYFLFFYGTCKCVWREMAKIQYQFWSSWEFAMIFQTQYSFCLKLGHVGPHGIPLLLLTWHSLPIPMYKGCSLLGNNHLDIWCNWLCGSTFESCYMPSSRKLIIIFSIKYNVRRWVSN